MNKKGFTLIEIMIVVAIIAFLSMISIPSLTKVFAKSKRAEPYTYLRTIAMAEKIYFGENDKYTDRLSGPNSINWKPEGDFNYTYGFAGTEGTNFFSGKLPGGSSFLSGAHASNGSFLVYAAADIDGDGTPDIITIDDKMNIKILQDDLA